MVDYNQGKNILLAYQRVYDDILNNRNLDAHKKDVEDAIKEIEISIDSAIQAGTPHVALSNIRNALFYLKYEILERT